MFFSGTVNLPGMTSKVLTSCEDHPAVPKASALKDLALVGLGRLALAHGFRVVVVAGTATARFAALTVATAADMGDWVGLLTADIGAVVDIVLAIVSECAITAGIAITGLVVEALLRRTLLPLLSVRGRC